MKIKKRDLTKMIQESVKAFIKKESLYMGRGTKVYFTLPLEVGEVEVSGEMSSYDPGDYMNPPEGGDFRLLGLSVDGTTVTLSSLAEMESELAGVPVSEDEIYERIQELAVEDARDRSASYNDDDY